MLPNKLQVGKYYRFLMRHDPSNRKSYYKLLAIELPPQDRQGRKYFKFLHESGIPVNIWEDSNIVRRLQEVPKLIGIVKVGE